MHADSIPCLLFAFMTGAFLSLPLNAQSHMKMQYPTSKRLNIADTMHGVVVRDPYRWLEDDHSDETKAWVSNQNKLTHAYLDKIPFRPKIKQVVHKLLNTPSRSTPEIHGKYLYYHKNNGHQNQSVFYRKPIEGGIEELVLDPNSFSKDGTSSLGTYSFSNDNKYLAYQISKGGADWKTIKILDLSTLKPLEDTISYVKFSGISWAGKGFYYSRYPKDSTGRELMGRAENHSLYYHALFSDQRSDHFIYKDMEDPLRNVYAGTSKDERWLVVSVAKGTSGNKIYVKDLKREGYFIPVNTSFETDYNFIGSEGNNLYFYTNDNAPNYKVVRISLDEDRPTKPITVIEQRPYALTNVKWHKGKFFAHYLTDAMSDVQIFDHEGHKIGHLELPGPGTFYSLHLSDDQEEGYFGFTSFTRPPTVYHLDLNTLQYSLYYTPKSAFNPDEYVTIQKKYRSYDGTVIPLFISYRKDLNLKEKHPTLLYGYGGFNIPITPSYSSERAALMQMGGVFVVANIRGGGEYGEAWHQAGTLAQKQNVFNDFQSAAEYLYDEGWAKPGFLAIEGRSNGGLLAGACLTQRPDLYSVVFPIVGVLDMLRYHLFTIGWAWASDYGKSSDPRAFSYLRKYSPLHNVQPAFYPSTMVMTADHDDRVVPAHSFKFAATLQHEQLGQNPVLIRIDHNAGHGAGKSLTLREEEMVDKLSFLWYEMGLTP